MIRYLLDTDTISQLALGEGSTAAVTRIRERLSACALGSPTVHELAYGIARLPEGRRRQALDGWLRDLILPSFPILSYDVEAARWHAAERARLERLGVPLPLADGQIAAIAAANGLVLVTGNVRHLAAVRGLDVQNWLE